MDNYEIFEIDNDENEYKYNLQINNIHNINIQEEQTKKLIFYWIESFKIIIDSLCLFHL